MSFCEPLPPSCPPASAQDKELEGFIRLVENDVPVEQDFWSHAKLGRQRPPEVDECSWASCSLISQGKAITLLKNPRHANKKAISVHLKKGHGVWLADKPNHVHFWRYSHVSLEEIVK